ncbi:MAG: histidinol-phosphate transaminase [Gammaproteobacteria bacterium]|jgi:histidinol-phosphate aminotransferase
MTNNKTSKIAGAGQTLDDLVSRWVRPEVRKIAAYHVPDPADLIKLDAMENPYPWPESLRDDWLAQLRQAAVNRYPDPAARALKQALQRRLEIPAHCSLLLGNGSDELIQMLAMAVAQPGRLVLSPEPGFVMYQMIATMTGMDYQGVPLKPDFSLDTPAMLKAIRDNDPALVFLAYPNNPTGNLFDKEAVRAIVETSQGLVIVDEAYHAFAGDSLVDWLDRYNNLLVMRTVSKMGLAGLRLGYLVGDAQWLEQIDKMRLPYNINSLTQISARFALEHFDIFHEQTQQICKDRQWLYEELEKLDSTQVFPSRANFILFRVKGISSQTVFDGLREHGILIKNLGKAPGLLKDCLRVTVGTPQENTRFIEALRQIVPQQRGG